MPKMKPEYKELAIAKIQERRNIVISENNKGSITIAQQLVVDDGQRTLSIFLKGAIFIDSDKLVDLRDAINEALEKLD